ncbi:MAG: hypothetical protein IKP14_09640 [Clostridiales bacterium]|nr:hypothetical protein [Clostridiales bacterium]
MSEEIKKNDLIDDVEDKEEYERALAALNKSKSARVKKIVDEKKAKKQKEKETQKKSSSGSSDDKSFIGKCKKDPVIPACILLIIIAAIGFGIYILVPMFSIKTLGVTVEDYRVRYISTSIYNAALAPYGFTIPEVTYQEEQNVALTAVGENSSSNQDKLLFFSAPIANTGTSFATAIQGSVRKTDNKITALRVIAEYSNDPNYFNFLVLYFGSYLQAFIPGVSDQDIQALVTDAVNNISTGEFTIRQDIAFRVSIVTTDTVNYVAFDIMPSGNL